MANLFARGIANLLATLEPPIEKTIEKTKSSALKRISKGSQMPKFWRNQLREIGVCDDQTPSRPASVADIIRVEPLAQV